MSPTPTWPKSWHTTSILFQRVGQRLKNFVNRPSAEDSEERRPLLASSGHHGVSQQDASSQYLAKVSAGWTWIHDFITSDQGKGVLKCSLAYLLGSLATFIPAISTSLGHQDGKHLVATITVYFHPARSRGSMFKALICASLAFLYATFISITSMCVAMFFENYLGLLPVGHAIVLILLCGGGLGFIGWIKQRLNDPLVNVACSLASLAIITVLTKEGAVQQGALSFAKIFQVLKMLLMGVCATMAVSFLIFPISARKQLRANLMTMSRTLTIMLTIIVESFLSGSEEVLYETEFINAATQNKKAYSQLDNLVKESKLEHYVSGTERQYRLEKNLVRLVQDINQNLGGLESAAALQFPLLGRANSASTTPLHNQRSFGGGLGSAVSPSIYSFPEESMIFASAGETPGEISDSNEYQPIPNSPQRAETEVPLIYSPRDMFQSFIRQIGPSMTSLAFTLRETFEDIPFGPAPDYKVTFNSRYQINLERALRSYRVARKEALSSLSRQKSFSGVRYLKTEANFEEVFASCGHFSFSLLEFGEQLKDSLAILDQLKFEEERPVGRSWNWLKFWRLFCGRGNISASNAERSSSADEVNATVSGSTSGNTSSDSYIERHTKERLGYRLWKALHFFRRDETKFALKVGTGAALYALPSFLFSTRPIYSLWRGEWGLLSYMLVCSMTIGASNTTGYARFFGTCLGGFCAVAAWYITGAGVYGLALLGVVMATWTAYIILVKGQGPMGRFIMLTYNLSVLYAYSLSRKESDHNEDEGGVHPIIRDIVLHRVVAVLSGCIWGIIITRLIWPISARKKLKHGLSVLWLQMSLIWKRDPLSMMVDGTTGAVYLSSREKLLIDRSLSQLESLQVSARSELELKSAFPVVAYQNILLRTRRMLNSVYVMNLEILKNVTASEGEISLLQYTTLERRQLTFRISHLLSVLASSMKLEYPLNDVLPNIEHARGRLLARIFRYRRDKKVSHLTTDGDYALLYAYVLVTGQLCNEIMEIIGEISRLFGVLSEDVIKVS